MTRRSDLGQTFGFLVSDIARLLREHFNSTAESLGLTLAQSRVLARLAANEGIQQSELAALLEVQPITLLRQIDRLEAMGLVERRAHPTDRRALQLFLTRTAQPLMNRLVRLGEGMQEELFTGIAHQEREVLYALLDRIRTNLTTAGAPRTPGVTSTASRKRRQK